MKRSIASFVLVLAILPSVVTAQTGGIPSQIVPCTGAACKCADIVTLIQNLINFGIFAVVILAAALFAYAGFQMLTAQGDASKYSKARGVFANVALGLVIMLSAWLVVDTLMKSVLGGNFGPWNAVAPLDGMCRLLGITGQ